MGIPAMIAGAALSTLSSGAQQAIKLGFNAANQKVLGDIQNQQKLALLEAQPQTFMSGLEQAGLNPLLATGSAPNMSGGASAQQATQAQVDPTKQAKASAQQTDNFIKFLRAIKSL